MKTKKTSINDTRAALLECAEELFLAHGFEAVSIRQLSEAAGANVAAVNYHFSGKTNLYREVLTRQLDEIVADKLGLLRELSDELPTSDLEKVLKRYIRSYFDSMLASPDSDRLLQVVYREMGPDAIASDLVADRLVMPIHRAFQKMILKALPNLDEEYVSYCVSSIMGQVLHFIRSREVLREIRSTDQKQKFIDETVDHITQFSLRGLGSNHHA